MIVVTTPTGKIGSQLLSHLLDADQLVRIVARNPDKLDRRTSERVEIVSGSSDDPDVLVKAFQGAEAAFLVVPPSFSDNNDTEYYVRFTAPAIEAAKRCDVGKLVGVSVLGRGTPYAKHAGPITASLAKDDLIQESGIPYRALWCPALMENMLSNLQSIKYSGRFSSVLDPQSKMPQVATRDVASAAAALLIDSSWQGQGGKAVLGPEDLSMTDMADIMSEVFARPVRYQQVSGAAYKAQLMQYGANDVFAQGIVDMLIAKDAGMDNQQPRTAENTTPTSFRQYCEDTLKPALQATS